jgi:hypothetical protein
MTSYFPIFIFILFAAAAYLGRRHVRLSRSASLAICGLGFCVMSFNLWAVTRMDDIIASLPGTHDPGIFSTPWPWVSALCVGVALLVVSFFTRVRHDHAT